MTFVQRILGQMKNLHKPQRKFMAALFTSLFACVGRATMANLSRYGAGSRRRIHRWKARPFDFYELNLLAIKSQGITSHRTALVFDGTFLKKSGKKTYGIAHFYNGCASRSERGLEAGVFGLLDLDENTAYPLIATQTPPEFADEETRIDFYAQQVQKHSQELLQLSEHLVVDGALAKVKFIDGVKSTGLEVVGKMRHDANLRYLYEGPQKGGPGRPKQYDGKVDYDDLSRLECTVLEEEGLSLKSGVLNHPTFKRNLKVVIVGKQELREKGKRGHMVLYSTDLRLSALDILRMYQARFQIEFVFRDGKQYTGLEDGQMRDQVGLDFHINTALSGVNLLRLEARLACSNPEERVISLGSWKRRKYNQVFMKAIYRELELNPNDKKLQAVSQKLSNFGAWDA